MCRGQSRKGVCLTGNPILIDSALHQHGPVGGGRRIGTATRAQQRREGVREARPTVTGVAGRLDAAVRASRGGAYGGARQAQQRHRAGQGCVGGVLNTRVVPRQHSPGMRLGFRLGPKGRGERREAGRLRRRL